MIDKLGERIGFFALFFTMMSISSSPHPMLLVLCYLIHEFGHVCLAKVTKVDMKKIKTGPFQLRLAYDSSFASYKSELLVCAGGVLFNFLSAAVTLLFVEKSESASFFLICNLSLGLMNLYPVSTLDGGRIFKCLLMMLFEVELALKIWKTVSFLFAFLLWLCAAYLLLVFDSNASLFFVSVFLLVELCFSA